VIENELKYVLDYSILSAMPKYGSLFDDANRMQLSQCYFNRDGRFRSVSTVSGTYYTFTYKIPLPDGTVEEFEQIIDAESFDRVSPLCQEMLIKDRYTQIEGGITWDIDIFRTSTGIIYWIMAEAEMPVGQTTPDVLLPAIQDHLLYAVPRGETSKFTSRKLANQAYAAGLMKSLQSA
jgi:CYTH domain-containing protein